MLRDYFGYHIFPHRIALLLFYETKTMYQLWIKIWLKKLHFCHMFFFNFTVNNFH